MLEKNRKQVVQSVISETSRRTPDHDSKKSASSNACPCRSPLRKHRLEIPSKDTVNHPFIPAFALLLRLSLGSLLAAEQPSGRSSFVLGVESLTAKLVVIRARGCTGEGAVERETVDENAPGIGSCSFKTFIRFKFAVSLFSSPVRVKTSPWRQGYDACLEYMLSLIHSAGSWDEERGCDASCPSTFDVDASAAFLFTRGASSGLKVADVPSFKRSSSKRGILN